MEAEIKASKNEFDSSKRGFAKESEAHEALIETLKQENKRFKLEIEKIKIDQKFNIDKKENANSSNQVFNENDKVT